MEVREATQADIPAIVILLKKSLGESLMPKSEAYWKWKHVENPFGPSPVLVCWQDNELIGVRAFMRWRWTRDGDTFSAVRAVDTATHPDYQGKGIFKKLTLSLVETCTQRGDQFVFNTPNQQSRPGYLKMGWVDAGRVSLKIDINRPFHILKNILAPQDGREGGEDSVEYFLNHPSLDTLINYCRKESKELVTDISAGYLKWRYFDVPVAKYLAVGEEEGGELSGIVIVRLKRTRLGREMRVTDCFFRGSNPGKILKERLKDLRHKWGVDFCTVSATSSKKDGQILRRLLPTLAIGPLVTIRSLGMNNLDSLKNFKNWSPSLGDLELF